MKRLLPILPVLLLALSGCQTTGGNDKDWNLHFYDDCGMPKFDSMQWIEEGGNKFIRFQLRDKDYGGCKSDSFQRHGAPYWERAELKQSNPLDWNSKYELEFNVRFVRGFSGDRETFWQMHATNSDCKTYPPLMFKINQGRLLLAALREDGRAHDNHYTNLKINDLLGKWSLFKLKFDTSETPVVSLFVDDKEIISGVPYGIESCGAPHFKFGIYRPGRKTRDGADGSVEQEGIWANHKFLYAKKPLPAPTSTARKSLKARYLLCKRATTLSGDWMPVTSKQYDVCIGFWNTGKVRSGMVGGYPCAVAEAKMIGLTPDECRKIRFAYKAEPKRSAEEEKRRLAEIARREAEEAERRRLAELAAAKAAEERQRLSVTAAQKALHTLGLYGTKRSVIDFDKINLTVLDTDYKKVFCSRIDKLISNSKIYSADKCEPGDKKLTSYQFNAISRFLKKGLSEDILRERVEWILEHPDGNWNPDGNFNPQGNYIRGWQKK